MLAKLYRALPPGGVWLLASAAFFMLGALVLLGSDNSRMSTLGLVGALMAVLLAVAFAGRGPQQRRKTWCWVFPVELLQRSQPSSDIRVAR